MKNGLIWLAALLLCLPLSLDAQSRRSGKSSQGDSLVRLISADSLQFVEIRGVTYRKVVGRPARFLHNDTYLLCDSALWNTDTRIINAMGHVKMLQEETELTGDKLTYYIDNDLAEFRGTLVQLRDKDNNTLRTRYLDYNTRDSVAVFRNGGSMRDKDGQIIESRTGTYESKPKLFTFTDDVNMYTDSVFVKTTNLVYESRTSTANFGYGTNAWKDEYMLTANSGWYDREIEKFFFTKNVHVMSDDQEGWCDSLYFWRNTNDVTMLGNVQVTDTTRNVYSLAGRVDYLDSIRQVTMLRDPAVISELEEKDKNGETQKDTVYFGADTLIYRTFQRWQIDSMEVVHAKERLEAIGNDPVSTLRREAAEAAAKAAQEAAENDPNNPAYYERQRREQEEARKQAEGSGEDVEGGKAKDTPTSVVNREKILSTAEARAQARKEEKEARRRNRGKDSPSVDVSPSSDADSAATAVPDTASVTDSVVTEIPDTAGLADGVIAEESDIEDVADNNVDEESDVAGKLPSSRASGFSVGKGAAAGGADRSSRFGGLPEENADDAVSDADITDVADSADVADSLPATDSTAVADTVALAPKDTTEFGFLQAYRKVRVFRKSMQIVCDSLSYNDLDSLARMYYSPIVWNEEGRHEYTADSIYAVIRNQAMEKANLMSNAFIHIQEDTVHYDQIKSAEMTAFFDTEGQLSRFDALGGSSALFYIEEKDALATVNKKDCKMLSALFKDGQINRIYYFETAKSDAYPVVQMSKEDQTLKGFNWQPDLRPADKNAVTPLTLRPSQRSKYAAVPKSKFVQTDIYFPGYISDVYRQLQIRDSMRVVRAREREIARKEAARLAEQARLDSLGRDSLIRAGVLDSLGNEITADSLAALDSIPQVDSLAAAVPVMADSSAVAPVMSDSLATVVAAEPTKQELKEMEKARVRAEKEAAAAEKARRREEARLAREAVLDAKWAQKDSLYKIKQEKKAAKKQEAVRKKKAKALRSQMKLEEEEKAKIARYEEKYRRKLEKKAQRRKDKVKGTPVVGPEDVPVEAVTQTAAPEDIENKAQQYGEDN